ncbi:hypothetical protein ACLI09_01920 [Flavobacterium sp. RHBU_24]|uniref:hypothetical protein n=1 Tax=Flavobacterium sp. RHBU_24 TaxID=3391185 RepID=UPI0039851833
MNDRIKAFSKSAIVPLLKVSENGPKQQYQFDIDCFEMKDYNYVNVLKDSDFSQLFDAVANISGPCLYYFTIESDHDADEIISRIQAYKNTPGAKSVPAIKKKFPRTKVLYVGKVKKALWGRLVQHLGYYKVSRTQGLQLFYWTQGTNVKLKMSVLEFEHEMADYMSVLETKLAKELQPIVGKHR